MRMPATDPTPDEPVVYGEPDDPEDQDEPDVPSEDEYDEEWYGE